VVAIVVGVVLLAWAGVAAANEIVKKGGECLSQTSAKFFFHTTHMGGHGHTITVHGPDGTSGQITVSTDGDHEVVVEGFSPQTGTVEFPWETTAGTPDGTPPFKVNFDDCKPTDTSPPRTTGPPHTNPPSSAPTTPAPTEPPSTPETTQPTTAPDVPGAATATLEVSCASVPRAFVTVTGDDVVIRFSDSLGQETGGTFSPQADPYRLELPFPVGLAPGSSYVMKVAADDPEDAAPAAVIAELTWPVEDCGSTPTTSPPTAPPSSNPPSVTPGPPGGTLPPTGTDPRLIALLGVLAVIGGILLVRQRRRPAYNGS
jgi:hypothetical protein